MLFLTPFFAHILNEKLWKYAPFFIDCYIFYVVIEHIFDTYQHIFDMNCTYFMSTNTYCQPHSLNIFRCPILDTILCTYSRHHFLWKYAPFFDDLYILYVMYVHILCQRIRIASPIHWTYSDVLFLTPFFAHILDIIFCENMHHSLMICTYYM